MANTQSREGTLVFVYGTLRKQEKNHHFLMEAELVTEQCWCNGRLYDAGDGYPALVPISTERVYGELYRVKEEHVCKLNRLKEYYMKGAKNDSIWQELPIYTDNGRMVTASVYVYGMEQAEAERWIQCGDWKRYKMSADRPLLYFAYGSCMHHYRLQEAGMLDRFQLLGRGVLHGYTLMFTHRSTADGKGRADIMEYCPYFRDRLDVVEGKLYEIDHEALDYLYVREGVHHGSYRPAFVDVEMNGKVIPNVLTFTVVHKQKETSPPLVYAQEIIHGGQAVLSDRYMVHLQKLLNRKFDIKIR